MLPDIDKIKSLLLYDAHAPMIFNSGVFLFFFFAFLLMYRAVYRNKEARTIYLLLFSLYFLYKSSGLYFLLLVLSAAVDYYLANLIYRAERPGIRKALVITSVVMNLGFLGYFKYTNFLLQLFTDIGLGHFDFADIFLPVGISFYTFQSLSYTIDIYRGKLIPSRRFSDFCFYVSFFPHLVAGPIVRAADFLPQIEGDRYISREDIGKALFLILTGLFRKAVIADYISVNFVDRIFSSPLQFSGVENLLGVYAYAIQIYCDFSGYSDMAIGVALLLGYRLKINFDAPYQSASITEFWRRWHISLSSWLRDYLYIALGGNRKGKIRQYFNLMMTMLLGGLWHGASWKFVFWGWMHGVALMVDKAFESIFHLRRTRLTHVLGVALTFHFVCFCWIFFRADSFETAVAMVQQILFSFNGGVFAQWVAGYSNVFILILLGFVLHFIPTEIDHKVEKFIAWLPWPGKSFALAAIIWLIIQVKSADILPFIYFQF
jgi:D-alanyl-lipoteichoic acid acyltransferase DltB (MBOAT superfamily)